MAGSSLLLYGVCISDIATINEEKAITFLKKYAKTDPKPLEEFMGSGDSNGDLLPFEEWVRYYEYKTKELTKDQYIEIMDKYINEFTDSHLSMEWWFVEDN